MEESRKRPVLLIMIDAFDRRYLDPVHTPFLQRLAGEEAWRLCKNELGFCEYTPALTGLSPEESGNFTMFRFAPERSPFRWTRWLGPLVNLLPRPRLEWLAVKLHGLWFHRTAHIPKPWLKYFEVSELRTPFWTGETFGGPSIFDVARRCGVGFRIVAGPDQWVGLKELEQRTRAALQPDSGLYFIHVTDLDAAGHRYGPDPEQLATCLQAVDQFAADLVARVEAVHGLAPELVVFSDHGMIAVEQTVDVAAWLSQWVDLRPGRDYLYFLDSTMARFWELRPGALSEIRRAMSDVPGLRLLTPDDLAEHRIRFPNREYGDLIYLADPGILVFPNFFQAEAPPVKGMHGYSPGDERNHGVAICRLHGTYRGRCPDTLSGVYALTAELLQKG